MTRLLIAFVCVGFVFVAPPTWESLGKLTAGTPVEVVSADRVERGEFVSSSTESLTVHTARGEQKFPRRDVVRVVSRGQSHRVRNILIGVGVGAAIGLAKDQTLGAYVRNESNPPGARPLIWGIPIAVCGGIGAALPSHPVIYRK